jgi:hypothetical protein
VAEYRDASAALPLSLDPVAPSPALKARLLEGLSGAPVRSAPVFTRVFWGVAALALFALIGRTLFHPVECHELTFTSERGASGSLVWMKRDVEVRIKGLPPLPPDKVYQLWHIMPGMPKPRGQKTFVLDENGILVGTDSMKDQITRNCSFAITMEPRGGSTDPTMPLYALALARD